MDWVGFLGLGFIEICGIEWISSTGRQWNHESLGYLFVGWDSDGDNIIAVLISKVIFDQKKKKDRTEEEKFNCNFIVTIDLYY